MISKIVAIALASTVAASASAATIDFEDLGVAAGTQLNPAPGVGVTSGGFDYTPGPDNSSGLNDLHIINEQGIGASNGTTVGGTHTDVVLTKSGGGTFSINQFDFAGFPTNSELAFRVIGDLFGGRQIFASFSPDGIVDGMGGAADFETFFFGPAWTNLIAVTWHHPGGTQGLFSLDNIVVDETDVPEPGMIGLLGLGLLGFAAARRRSR